MELRWYQSAAVSSVYDYFSQKAGNPIIALPTGTGKSIVIAELLRDILSKWAGQKIMILTHVKELVAQNYKELMELWPMAPAGIYSAGLNKRQVAPITFAGIASVVDKAALFGHIDLVLIDECHLLPPHDDTNYRDFLAALLLINPKLKVIGLSATPYRMGQGMLTDSVPDKKKKGERIPGLFTDVCYDMTGLKEFNQLIAEGFLCPLVPKRVDAELDVSKVKMTAGEYNQGELQEAVDKIEITRKAIDETLRNAMLPDGSWRTRWLVFATGVEHADHIATELTARGVPAHAVHSKMPAAERDKHIKWFKGKGKPGEVRVLTNNNVLTTGHNFPAVDMIMMLRPTGSPSLWVQMLGRGTRPFPGKQNCLVLDFAGNSKRLGPINDPVIPKRKGKKDGGEPPVKVCEKCDTYNHASVRFCVHCGHEFPRHVRFGHVASTAEIIRGEVPLVHVFPVDRIEYREHISRQPNKPNSMKVTYTCGLRQFGEYIPVQHEGDGRNIARRWWRKHTDGQEPPHLAIQAVALSNTLKRPTHIRVFVNAPYPRIMDHDFTGTAFGGEPQPNQAKPTP